ncbi:hypothetical protein ACFQ4K_01475 [Tistrella bauzanensis]
MDRQTGRDRQPRSACAAMALASMLALAPVMSVPAGAAEPRVPLPTPFSMAYYESWSELPGVSGPDTLLAATPAHVDVLAIGFAKPDLVYRGIWSWTAPAFRCRCRDRFWQRRSLP